MPIAADQHLAVLRSIAESTRVRIVAVLRHGELTVTDLTEVLGQSQPRISRHLRLLGEAGVVKRNREGNFMFFSLVRSGPIRSLTDGILDQLDIHAPPLTADAERLEMVRQRRTEAGQEYFGRIAADWDRVRTLHAPDEIVEAAVRRVAAERPYASLLDVGTGTGRMLQVLAGTDAPSRPERIVGLDSNPSMLAVARSNLDQASIDQVELRQGNVHQPPFDDITFDLVVMHQVLHFLDDPDRALDTVSRLVAPHGQLIVIDFAPHTLDFLQHEHAHRRLGFRADVINGWLTDAGLDPSPVEHIGTHDDRLTVTLWSATNSFDRAPLEPAP